MSKGEDIAKELREVLCKYSNVDIDTQEYYALLAEIEAILSKHAHIEESSDDNHL